MRQPYRAGSYRRTPALPGQGHLRPGYARRNPAPSRDAAAGSALVHLCNNPSLTEERATARGMGLRAVYRPMVAF